MTRHGDLLPSHLLRDSLLIALTIVTGVCDAIAFTQLGSVFTSVMTGNMVLLGIAFSDRNWVDLTRVGVAFASYIGGSMLGAWIAREPEPDQHDWPTPIIHALTVQFAVFAVFCGLWWLVGPNHGTTPSAMVLVGLLALGLGIQSSAVVRLGIPGLSTTYLTGTLTLVVRAIALHRSLRGHVRPFLTLAALVLGAAIGMMLAHAAPVIAPAAPALTIAVVIAGGLLFRLPRTGPLEAAVNPDV